MRASQPRFEAPWVDIGLGVRILLSANVGCFGFSAG